MGLVNDLLKHANDFRKVFAEADQLETEHYEKQGWKKEKGEWTQPNGQPWVGESFDGPGSHVSVFSFFDPAAKSLGIDISDWTDTGKKVKVWIERLRK